MAVKATEAKPSIHLGAAQVFREFIRGVEGVQVQTCLLGKVFIFGIMIAHPGVRRIAECQKFSLYPGRIQVQMYLL